MHSFNHVQTKSRFENNKQCQCFLGPNLNVHKHNQPFAVNSPFIVQFKLNLWKMREESTDRFSAGFRNKNNNDRRIIFPLIQGAPA